MGVRGVAGVGGACTCGGGVGEREGGEADGWGYVCVEGDGGGGQEEELRKAGGAEETGRG